MGDPPSALRTLRTDLLAAVVSDAPPGLRAKRRDVMAHQDVLETLMAGGATLPMRFGLVGPGDDEVTAALDRQADAYRDRLAELDGRVEYNLKAGREEDDLLREIMTESDDIRELNERTRAHGGHDDRVALGELVAREVTARHQREAEDVAARLAEVATRSSHAEAGPAAVPQPFLPRAPRGGRSLRGRGPTRGGAARRRVRVHPDRPAAAVQLRLTAEADGPVRPPGAEVICPPWASSAAS